MYDGAELDNFLLSMSEGKTGIVSPRGAPTGVGSMSLVVGTTVPGEDDGDGKPRRVVGVEQIQNAAGDGGESQKTVSLGDATVFEHTVAEVPNSISDADAMSTAAAAVVGIHCSVPKVENVGGGSSDSDVFYSGKAVVLGGNEYACFFAEGLAALKIDVSLVSTGAVKVNNRQVKTMQPSADNDVGFCTAIGRFDTLVDTMYDERKGSIPNSVGVIQLLARNHQCSKYVSTFNKPQQIIKDEGVLFGPGKANSLAKSLESMSPSKCTQLIPSSGFGPRTLTTLFQNGVVFPSKNDKSVVARGWSMKDFWTYTSWPRDSSDSGLRFGLPALDDEKDLDEEFRRDQLNIENLVIEDQDGEEDLDDVEEEKESQQENPYVTKIRGVEGLAENIISKRRDGVVFVAMRSCRTCKSLDSPFTRLARDYDGDLTFAKADATGKVGKQLGRQLGIEAVPSFVLFRDGKRYGSVSTSRLPSAKLSKAISDLTSGADFDLSLEE